jgi:hypothetical protein
MKSSRLSLFVCIFCAFLPFGAWGEDPAPASQPAQTTEQTSEEKFGMCAITSTEICYQVEVNGVKQEDAVKMAPECIQGYRYDEAKKKQVWFRTETPKCKELYKKLDKQKADKKKKQQQASSQPANPTNSPAANPPVTKNTLTIEITREEWEALLAKVNGLTPGDPNYTTIIQEIRNRLSLNDGNIAKEGTSREKEIRDLQTIVNSIDGQIKGLQKQIDDEAAARKAADNDLWADSAKQWNAINAFAVDRNTQQGHQVFMEYLLSGSLVNNEYPGMDHFMGLGLRLGILQRVGVHGSVGVDLNMINRVPTANGQGYTLQLGLGYPDVMWSGGFDFKRNDKVTTTVEIRGVHRALSAVGGITTTDIDVVGCGGVEMGVFKKHPNSQLTLALCAGVQSDTDPSITASAHIGLKHGLWTKEKE